MGFHFGTEGSGGADELSESFVAGGEMFGGGVEVEGESGRLVGHGAVFGHQRMRIAQIGWERKKNESIQRFAIVAAGDCAQTS